MCLSRSGMSGRSCSAAAGTPGLASQVLDLEIASGYVTARVQGSRTVPYKVRIQVLPLTKAQWQRVELALAGQALFRAKLLGRGDARADRGGLRPVRHAAAVPPGRRVTAGYAAARAPDWGSSVQAPGRRLLRAGRAVLDDDPFGLLAWRGRDRDALLRLPRSGRPAAGAGGLVIPGWRRMARSRRRSGWRGRRTSPPRCRTFPAPPLAECVAGLPGRPGSARRGCGPCPLRPPRPPTCCCVSSSRPRWWSAARTWPSCWARPTTGSPQARSW